MPSSCPWIPCSQTPWYALSWFNHSWQWGDIAGRAQVWASRWVWVCRRNRTAREWKSLFHLLKDQIFGNFPETGQTCPRFSYRGGSDCTRSHCTRGQGRWTLPKGCSKPYRVQWDVFLAVENGSGIGVHLRPLCSLQEILQLCLEKMEEQIKSHECCMTLPGTYSTNPGIWGHSSLRWFLCIMFAG